MRREQRVEKKVIKVESTPEIMMLTKLRQFCVVVMRLCGVEEKR